ncbi:MAG TPA: hypothetical protein VN688_21490 [Gemmataceae bacterium]|nr:hypothetical protein [Gemmataceae bacterium]
MEDIAAASLGVPADLFGNVRHLLEAALLREEAERRKGKPIAPGDDEIDIVFDAGNPLFDSGSTQRRDEPLSDPEDAETIRRREVMALLERLLFGTDDG